MAGTKQELAEGLTVAQLRELAGREGVDLKGKTTKDEIAQAVASSVSKEALDSASGDTAETSSAAPTGEGTPSAAPSGDEPSATGTGTSSTTDEPDIGPIEDAQEQLPPLGIRNPDPVVPPEADVRAPAAGSSPEELQKAGMSPADLEIKLAPGGAPIIVRQNPEAPTPHQVLGSVSEVPGPADIQITVTDGATGEEVPHALGPGDLVQMSQRAQASVANHPSNLHPGWSNPNLTEMTDEQKAADQQAYADRFGSVNVQSTDEIREQDATADRDARTAAAAS